MTKQSIFVIGSLTVKVTLMHADLEDSKINERYTIVVALALAWET